MPRDRIRRAAFFCFFAATFLLPAAAQAAGLTGWTEVRSPHFVVVTNSSEKDARKTAIQFEQIRGVFREALPLDERDTGPVITILAMKDEASLSQLLPEYWTPGHAHPAGLFENSFNQYYIAINLDAQGPNPYETIYHEYYHSLSMPYYPDMPTWLSEGLADFFGNSEVDGKIAVVGQQAPELLYQLLTNKMIPLDTLFHVDRSSPYYNEDSKVTIFYAESWALVHYLMIGDKQAHKPMLTAYLNALTAGATEDDAAAKAFGNLKKLQSDLDDYIRRNAFYQLRYPAPQKVVESDLKSHSLSEADAYAYEGGFFIARGRSDDAKSALDRAIKLDPQNARAFQDLALTQFSLGEHSAALDAASKAIEFNPSSGLARYFRAYLTYNNAPGAPNPQIEDDLRQAIAGSPEFAPPYAMLAVYMTSQDENLPDALAAAQKAISIEPGNADFQLAEAQVLLRMENFSEARKALARARADAATSQQLLQADMSLSSLEEEESVAAAKSAKAAVDGLAGPSDPGSVQATGTVLDVTCSGGLNIQLSTDHGTLSLHSVPNRGVNIVSPSAIPPDFTPCSLKGSQITVHYTPAPDGSKSGIVRTLQLIDPKQ